ncbi:MAG: hypothetical protein HGA66_05515 [Holophaga sp.]|nr:hypothetical protein [Holophaga sp.]
MENQSVTPSPDPNYILGSKRRDRLVGIVTGIAWWVVGGILVGLSNGGLFPLLLIAFVGQLIYLGRRMDGRTMLLTIVFSTALVPVVIFLGLFGMCALKGFKLPM